MKKFKRLTPATIIAIITTGVVIIIFGGLAWDLRTSSVDLTINSPFNSQPPKYSTEVEPISLNQDFIVASQSGLSHQVTDLVCTNLAELDQPAMTAFKARIDRYRQQGMINHNYYQIIKDELANRQLCQLTVVSRNTSSDQNIVVQTGCLFDLLGTKVILIDDRGGWWYQVFQDDTVCQEAKTSIAPGAAVVEVVGFLTTKDSQINQALIGNKVIDLLPELTNPTQPDPEKPRQQAIKSDDGFLLTAIGFSCFSLESEGINQPDQVDQDPLMSRLKRRIPAQPTSQQLISDYKICQLQINYQNVDKGDDFVFGNGCLLDLTTDSYLVDDQDQHHEAISTVDACTEAEVPFPTGSQQTDVITFAIVREIKPQKAFVLGLEFDL